MINPYENINWANVLYTPSVSHAHCKNQTNFERILSGGIKHIALSNYHPSEAWYPLSEHFTVPDGVIGSPNAEFYNMDIASFHANGLGCNGYSEPEPNSKMDWKVKLRNALNGMQYNDAGGITLNHPHWTKAASGVLTNNDLLTMLDWDSRVLGIEFYNASSERYENLGVGWDLDTWDFILSTGRRCWGFCVPDHDAEASASSDPAYVWEGRNILLVSEFTEHECLKAYREGRFYGSLRNTSLKFNSISLFGNALSISTTDADYINFVVNGTYNRVNGSSATFYVPANATYVRVEAHNSENSIYSNPIMLREFASGMSTAKKMLVLGF